MIGRKRRSEYCGSSPSYSVAREPWNCWAQKQGRAWLRLWLGPENRGCGTVRPTLFGSQRYRVQVSALLAIPLQPAGVCSPEWQGHDHSTHDSEPRLVTNAQPLRKAQSLRLTDPTGEPHTLP